MNLLYDIYSGTPVNNTHGEIEETRLNVYSISLSVPYRESPYSDLYSGSSGWIVEDGPLEPSGNYGVQKGARTAQICVCGERIIYGVIYGSSCSEPRKTATLSPYSVSLIGGKWVLIT